MNTARIEANERYSHPTFGPGHTTMREFTATNGKQRVGLLTDGDNRIHFVDVAKLTSCARPTTVKPAGAFGGNSQSGRVAQHGTQSGYVMHRRAAQAEHDAAGPAHAAWCAGPSTHITECQPCKDAHATYMRRPPTIGDALAAFRS
jgi:hypothetical protein